MTRILAVLAAAALAAFFMPVAEAVQKCGPLLEQALYATVLIASKGSTGSGTVIYSQADDAGLATTLILTNHHVIANSVSVRKEWDSKAGKEKDRERRQQVKSLWFDYNFCSMSVGTRGKSAEIVAYDKPADLALLRLIDRERTIDVVADLRPPDSPLQLGTEVYAIGAGLGRPPFTTDGLIAIVDYQMQGYPYIMATAPIIFGNSGGGLFQWSNDRGRFELIGVPSKVSAAGWSAVTHMAWSIPVATVRDFLIANDFGYVVGEPEIAPAKKDGL
jgi:S1-C subfamily serine protease